MNTPVVLMYEIIATREKINRLSFSLNDFYVFGNQSLSIPCFVPSELGFLRTVSWLYVVLNEVGKIDIKYLKTKFVVYNLESKASISNFPQLVGSLRTYLQHNLNPEEDRNLAIQKFCEQWFSEQCKTPIPEDEEHWQRCLIGLLKEANIFFITILKCIRCVEADDSKTEILFDWKSRRERIHPPHDYDRLIELVIKDIGRDDLDIVRLRNRFYVEWEKELQIRNGLFDFNVEARKLIEHAILFKHTNVLPLTGHDIISILGIQPGPEVGKILEEARVLFYEERCSREELLARLLESRSA